MYVCMYVCLLVCMYVLCAGLTCLPTTNNRVLWANVAPFSVLICFSKNVIRLSSDNLVYFN